MAAISVIDLAKTYRVHRKQPGLFGSLKSLVRRQTLETRAVDGISFEIEAGEVVGFLGPNGAGKTTTLKMLCGLPYPSGGSATVLSHVPSRREHSYLTNGASAFTGRIQRSRNGEYRHHQQANHPTAPRR